MSPTDCPNTTAVLLGALQHSALYAAGLSEPTLIRTRGSFSCTFSAASTDRAQYVAALGIVRVKDEAIVAGVASIPTPLSDADEDWLFHRYFVGINVAGTPAQSIIFEIDSKAMRKMEGNDGLAIVLEAQDTSAVAALGMQFDFGLRCLFQDA